MADFLLIHGAWHGAWCWKKLVPALQKAGHQVRITNLPGHGGDPTDPASIHLETYAGHVVELLDAGDAPVILLGHSMGGMVITQAAEYRPDRIQALVYLTAFLPRNGESLLAIEERNPKASVPPNLVPDAAGITATINADQITNLFYHDCSEADIAFATRQLTPQPLAPLAEPVTLSDNNFGSIPRVYIECTEDRAICLEQQRVMHQATPCDRVFSLATSHSPFFSAPRELTGILAEIAG